MALLIFVVAGMAAAQEPSVHHGHGGHDTSMSTGEHSMTPAMQAKLLADKQESEFNHHLAGFLVGLAGVFIFFQHGLARRRPAASGVSRVSSFPAIRCRRRHRAVRSIDATHAFATFRIPG